jgi:hypothetical protein
VQDEYNTENKSPAKDYMQSRYDYIDVVPTQSGLSIHAAQREGIGHRLEDRFAVAAGRIAYKGSPNALLADMARQAVNNTSDARFEQSGSTFMGAFLTKDKIFHRANMGDSRAWVIAYDIAKQDVSIRQVTIDHSPANPRICKQIKDNGGVVMNVEGQARVMGRPMAGGGYETNAANGAGCGDLHIPGLLRKPQVYAPMKLEDMQREGKHVWVMLGSDGISDMDPGLLEFRQYLGEEIKTYGTGLHVAGLAVDFEWRLWEEHYNIQKASQQFMLAADPRVCVHEPHIDDLTAISVLLPQEEMTEDIFMGLGDGHGWRWDRSGPKPVLESTGHWASEIVAGTMGHYAKKLMTARPGDPPLPPPVMKGTPVLK